MAISKLLNNKAISPRGRPKSSSLDFRGRTRGCPICPQFPKSSRFSWTHFEVLEVKDFYSIL